MQKLDIILQGGGTRCAYQMAFLNKIIKNNEFNKKYEIGEIYGTSFGALVGYFLCINKLDILNNFFCSLNENSLKPHFDFWGYGFILKKIPLIGCGFDLIINVIWLIKSIILKSLYDLSTEFNKLFNFELSQSQKIQLNNFNCCVYNITKQKIQYINGSHPYILDYIIASCSMWILFKPKLIQQYKHECDCNEYCVCFKTKITHPNDICDCTNNKHKLNEFIDGGLLKPIPIQNFCSQTKTLVLTTMDIKKIYENKLNFTESGKHLLEYLENIISFLIDYNQYLDIQYVNKDWHLNENIHLVNYESITNSPKELNKEIIESFMADGIKLADIFLNDTVFRIPTNQLLNEI